MTKVETPSSTALPGERAIIAAVWPTLLASAVGLLPFTVLTAFLVPIADAAGAEYAEVGTLRGLAGLGAVLTGVAVAPLLGRIAPGTAAAAAMVLLGISAIIGANAWIPALAAFCLLTGIANAVLYPALSTAAADRFGDTPAAGRAATLVMTSQTLASMLGAPLLILPTLLWGWQGNLVAIGVVALALAPLLARYGRADREAAAAEPRIGYIAAFRRLAEIPGARPLLLVSFGRAGALMGHLAFLAPLYAHRFALTPGEFTLVWSLSGGSFFLGHLISGRLLNAEDADRRIHRMMVLSLVIALAALCGVYLAPVLPLALACTAILSASHAVVSAAVMSLLVRRCAAVRGTALSLNSAGMSLGLSLGASAAGAGLALGGYTAAAMVLAALTLISLAAALAVTPTSPRPSESEQG